MRDKGYARYYQRIFFKTFYWYDMILKKKLASPDVEKNIGHIFKKNILSINLLLLSVVF